MHYVSVPVYTGQTSVAKSSKHQTSEGGVLLWGGVDERETSPRPEATACSSAKMLTVCTTATVDQGRVKLDTFAL